MRNFFERSRARWAKDENFAKSGLAARCGVPTASFQQTQHRRWFEGDFMAVAQFWADGLPY
jgi:hypothetical protein